MAIVNLIMPKMGESIMEATILKWLKQPGDPVKMDEPILEIATDKVDSEVPSTVNGILGGSIGAAGGLVEGLAKAGMAGKYGTPEGANMVEQTAAARAAP
mgnify:CR=1 FL=1